MKYLYIPSSNGAYILNYNSEFCANRFYGQKSLLNYTLRPYFGRIVQHSVQFDSILKWMLLQSVSSSSTNQTCPGLVSIWSNNNYNMSHIWLLVMSKYGQQCTTTDFYPLRTSPDNTISIHHHRIMRRNALMMAYKCYS